MSELKKARETFTGEALIESLNEFRKKLMNPSIISADNIYTLLMSFREVLNYDSMVGLLEDIENEMDFELTPIIRYLWAFALSRRNKPGDRKKALDKIEKELKDGTEFTDLICLAARIHKDEFVESDYTDQESIDKAIYWYRRGFDNQPNEFAGINLATLLVIKGNDMNTSPELQNIASVLNVLIGRKGSLKSLQDYWDVATYFEISVLAENYAKAIEAAECMFNLKPPQWYLKSTILNIRLINDYRKKPENAIVSREEQVFQFWMEYFIEAAKTDIKDVIRVPVIILEIDKTMMPSYVTVNLDDQDGKSLQINNLCKECLKEANTCKRPHTWLFHSSNIRGIR